MLTKRSRTLLAELGPPSAITYQSSVGVVSKDWSAQGTVSAAAAGAFLELVQNRVKVQGSLAIAHLNAVTDKISSAKVANAEVQRAVQKIVHHWAVSVMNRLEHASSSTFHRNVLCRKYQRRNRERMSSAPALY